MPEQDPLAQIDDEDLALRMMEGEEGALRAALKAYGPKVKGFLRKQFGDQLDQSEVDYVFQQALINFWSKISTYDTDKGSLRGWWIRIARNAAISHLRGEEKHKSEVLEDPADYYNDTCGDVELVKDSAEKKRLERVHQFIHNKLVGDERTVALNCFAVGGDPDIVRLAAKLGKSRAYVDTVKSKVKKKIVEFVVSVDGNGRGKEK
ncbi:RNA polymerase sigma factor [Roseiconus lacunae]|uniref:RNA polymerase sigma factor n=1 Tax=Roseiconus lacunae TaxID=2605694 RepID=A0ABT7PP33_9BACT|nr:RNA polymerase sigma factor [Roseiconus lacunae]MDM4018231.1 RNA polymerase sigma factor [Roseiconus lacunae]